MRALIPAAGQGTRLYPQTHTKPKAMVRIAGRPILGHILDSLSMTDIDEVVVVVGGPMQAQIVEYVTETYGDRFDFSFPEQESPEGLGHSIYQAEEAARGEPLLIALGDMLFENGYASFLEQVAAMPEADGAIGVKQVAEPEHYGVVELTEERITGMFEKPSDPPSDLAISGVYIIRDTETLFDVLGEMIAREARGAGGEFQLTDALDEMVDIGGDFRVFEVEDWYDCGRPETLLEANRVMLADGAETVDGPDGSVLIEPVDIGEDVTLEGSVIGPNVSVDDGAEIAGSIVRDSLVGRNATLTETNLTGSIVGDNATIEGAPSRMNVGDNSHLEL